MRMFSQRRSYKETTSISISASLVLLTSRIIFSSFFFSASTLADFYTFFLSLEFSRSS